MDKELIERMNKAMKRIGGPLAVLNLPDEVKAVITNCPDYETRVKMLELVNSSENKPTTSPGFTRAERRYHENPYYA